MTTISTSSLSICEGEQAEKAWLLKASDKTERIKRTAEAFIKGILQGNHNWHCFAQPFRVRRVVGIFRRLYIIQQITGIATPLPALIQPCKHLSVVRRYPGLIPDAKRVCTSSHRPFPVFCDDTLARCSFRNDSLRSSGSWSNKARIAVLETTSHQSFSSLR